MRKNWHKFRQQYLSYSRSDRNAIIIIASLLLFVLIVRGMLKYFVREPAADFSEIKAAIEQWEKESAIDNVQKPLSLFDFDPNTVSGAKFDALDLPSFVKRNIVSYRNAGGVFVTARDMRKIYGLNDSIYKVISPYVKIAKKDRRVANQPRNNRIGICKAEDTVRKALPNYKKRTSPEKLIRNKKVELNTADSLALVGLSGIGPVFARRIIRYRNLLGGFYSTKQLLEVYHFSPETYRRITPYVYADTLKIRRIRINFADFSELLRHPYLNKKQVVEIIRFREKNGAIEQLSGLEISPYFDDVLVEKIKPYFTCR